MLAKLLQTNKLSLLLLLVLTILPFSVSFISLFFVYQYEVELHSFIFIQWVVFYVLCSFTMAFALTPTTYIALLSGYFLGWSSLLGILPSYLVASLLGFYFAKKIDQGRLLNQLSNNNKLTIITENIKKDELWVIFFCRISPALPFAMMNVFLSMMNVKFKNFVLGSFLGMLPRTLLSIWIGLKASDLVSMFAKKTKPDFSTYCMAFLLVASIVGLYLFFMRAMKGYSNKKA